MSASTDLFPIDHGGPIDWPFERFPTSALDGSAVDQFDAVARRFSTRPALDDGVRHFTYSQLARLTDAIAAAVAAATAQRRGPVAVLLRHEARFPAAILGVLAAGRCCVPLDADYPIVRNRLIATHATAAAVVSVGALAAEVRALFSDVPVLDIDAIEGELGTRPRVRLAPDDLAYVLYTSGSTGTPKGVYQNHRGLLHDIMQCVDTQHLSFEDRVALFYSPTVGSGFRIALSALLVGASLYVLTPRELGTNGLAQAIRERRITIFRSVATLFQHVAEALGPSERFDSLRLVVLGGDRVDWSDFDLFKRVCPPRARFGVHLGATEVSTIYLQCYVDEAMRAMSPKLPVGHPVPDRRTVLLDEDGRSVDDGEIGEFAVSSRYLAQGYWPPAELTAPFSIDPADPQARMYRTGDLGRRRPDGLYEHVGRKDQQIKLHGYRIEPGEIESALKACAGVRDAAIVVRCNEAGAPRAMVAYAEPRPEVRAPMPRHLLAMVAQRVPRHMVPAAIHVLDRLPRLPSLKIDRAQLARMDADRLAQATPETVRPATSDPATGNDQHQSVRTIVLDSLRRMTTAMNSPGLTKRLHNPEDMSMADLDLDSLHSIELCMEIQARTGVELDPIELAGLSSVDELVDLIVASKSDTGKGRDATRLERAPRDGPLPASFNQEWIWQCCRTPRGAAAYVVDNSNPIFGPLNVAVLRECLDIIVKRHEILRTTFRVVRGQLAQIVDRPQPVAMPLIQLTPGADPNEATRRIVKAEVSQINDLARGPLIRFSLLRINDNEHRLIRVSHHILSDARSGAQLVDELATLYQARIDGTGTPLPDFEPLQYGDYAAWQRKVLRRDGPAFRETVAWWADLFEHLPRQPDLPFKRLAPVAGLDPGDGKLKWSVEPDVAQRLDRLRRGEVTTPYVVWLAALIALLASETGRSDVVIGTYVTTRRRAELQGIMGDFSNLVTLRFQCDLAMSYRDWLSELRFWLTQAEQRCEIPPPMLRKELRRLNVTLPDVPIVFAAHFAPLYAGRHFANLRLTRDPTPPAVMPWGFTVFVHENDGYYEYGANFDAGINDPVAVRRFFDRLIGLIEAVSLHPERPLAAALQSSEEETAIRPDSHEIDSRANSNGTRDTTHRWWKSLFAGRTARVR